MTPETLARLFHEAYERLAPTFGYETRYETRQFDPMSKNGRLMVAVCDELLAANPFSDATYDTARLDFVASQMAAAASDDFDAYSKAEANGERCEKTMLAAMADGKTAAQAFRIGLDSIMGDAKHSTGCGGESRPAGPGNRGSGAPRSGERSAGERYAVPEAGVATSHPTINADGAISKSGDREVADQSGETPSAAGICTNPNPSGAALTAPGLNPDNAGHSSCEYDTREESRAGADAPEGLGPVVEAARAVVDRWHRWGDKAPETMGRVMSELQTAIEKFDQWVSVLTRLPTIPDGATFVDVIAYHAAPGVESRATPARYRGGYGGWIIDDAHPWTVVTHWREAAK